MIPRPGCKLAVSFLSFASWSVNLNRTEKSESLSNKGHCCTSSRLFLELVQSLDCWHVTSAGCSYHQDAEQLHQGHDAHWESNSVGREASPNYVSQRVDLEGCHRNKPKQHETIRDDRFT